LHATATATTIKVSDSSQHFTDGQKVSTGALLAAHVGDSTPAPFNGAFIGSDVSGPNFAAAWSMTFATPSGPVSGADLLFGILDADSAAPGTQVSLFSVNGVDLTASLNALFDAPSGANVNNGQNGTYNVYDVTLPAAVLPNLLGVASFTLDLQGPGLGILGSTTFDGAALDFATLTITSGSIAVAPEPGMLPVLTLIAAGALLFARFRTCRRIS
jgi:hypothetical protein